MIIVGLSVVTTAVFIDAMFPVLASELVLLSIGMTNDSEVSLGKLALAN